MKYPMYSIAIWLFIFLISGCAAKYNRYIQYYHLDEKSTIPDYNNLNYWAAHPWKKDPSDSIPRKLQGETQDSVADVFFIHPTTYTKNRTGWNADINNAFISAKTDYTSILYQASAFNQHCRVFAPRYRQAHLSAFFTSNKKAKPLSIQPIPT